MTDIELVEQIQNSGDSDAFQTLRERHAPLCTNKLKPFWGLLTSMGYSSDQILHERDLAIYRAIRTYSSGSAVGTWIANNVRFWCLNLLKKFDKNQHHEQLTDKTEYESKEKFLPDYDISEFADRTLDDLGPKVKLVFQERYILNKKIKEISRQTNIPIYQISKMNKTAREYLKMKIQETEIEETL